MLVPGGIVVECPPEVAAAHPGWRVEPCWRNEAGGHTLRLVGPGGRTRYVKLQPRHLWPTLADEAARLRWAARHLPVPEILGAGRAGSDDWLLTEGLPGTPLHAVEAAPERVAAWLAEGLRRVHGAPVATCPFRFDVPRALDHVADRVARGLVDPEQHFHPEHAHLTAEGALALLERTRPAAEDLVVCHGDACLPNVLVADGRVVGLVDLGELGVADRWWDLATATWSLTWNVGPGHEDALLAAYGIPRDDARLRWYRLLYDLAC